MWHSSAQIPKFSQHTKVCKILSLALRGHTHNMGDPGTSRLVCQGNLEKMLTFQETVLCPWHLQCWFSSADPTLTNFWVVFYLLITLRPTGHIHSQLSRLSFCCFAESIPVQWNWGASSLKVAERQLFSFLSFTAVLTTNLLHYFCYVLFIMLAQQLVSSAILL